MQGLCRVRCKPPMAPSVDRRELEMNKTALFFIFLVGLLLQSGGDHNAELHAQAQSGVDGTLVAVGDSLTEGLGVAEASSYPAVLEKKLQEKGYHYRVVNAGISGETSSGAFSRIKWILKLKPDIVILVTGANDGFRGIDPTLIKRNIRRIIQILAKQKVVVVLGGMKIVHNLGRDYSNAFEALYTDLAASEDVVFIPFFLAGVAAVSELNQTDGIHPNAEGYRQIVDNILPYVVEAVKKHRAVGKANSSHSSGQ